MGQQHITAITTANCNPYHTSQAKRKTLQTHQNTIQCTVIIIIIMIMIIII